MGDNDWDTVTKIGYKTHATRQTTVKGSSALNAAARTGPIASEKKVTGISPPPGVFLLFPSSATRLGMEDL